MSSEELNSHTIIAIISGILLTISEILPFISKIESNGLVHFLINAGNRLLAKENSEETEPLLPIYNKPKSNVENSEIAEAKDKNSDKETTSQKHGKDRSKKIKKRAPKDVNDRSDDRSDETEDDRSDETEPESEPVQKFLKRKRNDVRNKKNKVTEENKTRRRCLKTSEEYELDFLKNYIVTRYLDHIVILPSLHLCNKERFENMGYKVFYDHIDDKYTLKW
jgi:hypothetical protein